MAVVGGVWDVADVSADAIAGLALYASDTPSFGADDGVYGAVLAVVGLLAAAVARPSGRRPATT